MEPPASREHQAGGYLRGGDPVAGHRVEAPRAAREHQQVTQAQIDDGILHARQTQPDRIHPRQQRRGNRALHLQPGLPGGQNRGAVQTQRSGVVEADVVAALFRQADREAQLVAVERHLFQRQRRGRVVIFDEAGGCAAVRVNPRPAGAGESHLNTPVGLVQVVVFDRHLDDSRGLPGVNGHLAGHGCWAVITAGSGAQANGDSRESVVHFHRLRHRAGRTDPELQSLAFGDRRRIGYRHSG